jgi:hypothetical protein
LKRKKLYLFLKKKYYNNFFKLLNSLKKVLNYNLKS